MNTLIQALLDPKVYDHPAGAVSLLETHISWVLLAGEYAYKIKKPVDFGFLDFSTLDKRRHYCAEEVRLNRRLAPQIYLDVVPITGSPEQPRLGGSGPAFEYAVKMRRFCNAYLFDRLATENRLERGHIDALADEVAGFHARVERATAADGHGIPRGIQGSVMENFDQIRPSAQVPRDDRLDGLKDWCEREFARLEPVFWKRKAGGFVRECHGDLHLGNIVLIDGRPTPFDCIEFSEKLRWIDVISEIAFVVMDLTAHDRPDLGYRLLNRYLSRTGDYPALRLLRYYLFYRAMVRAKIAVLTLPAADVETRERLLDRYQRYVALAQSYTKPHAPFLVITHGLSGSGKSRVAGTIAERFQAVCLRSDVERKRLAGYAAEADTRSAIAGGIYTDDLTRATYAHLADTARLLLDSGFPVVVDAAFLKRWQRDGFLDAARTSGVPFLIADIHAPWETLRARVRDRLGKKKDPSEADIEVLEQQRRSHEPLDETERRMRLRIDTAPELDVDALVRRIRRWAGGH